LKILFLTESREDYLADSLLHGLISLGHVVVDYPKKSQLYLHAPTLEDSTFSVRGGGFTLYGLLGDRRVDRENIIQKLQHGFFDLVIFGQVWRQWGQLLDLSPFIQNCPVVLLDGDDDDRIFYLSGSCLRRYGLHRFPLKPDRSFYFKRELFHTPISRLYPFTIFPISFSIPSEKIISRGTRHKTKRFARHCVDQEIASHYGLSSSYAFDDEYSYYLDLSRSKYAITTKRGGWDCLRHYEIAAAGSLICFKELTSKAHSCAPHRLQPGYNCLSYSNLKDLTLQINQLEETPDQYQTLLFHSRNWILNHTTVAIAQRMLDSLRARSC
jgi:hypothetical protein